MTAVSEGKLTGEDVVARLHTNPKLIFELHDQPGTSVEVELDRLHTMEATPAWSPIAGRVLRGSVQRVTFQDQTVCLDGELLRQASFGKDMSTHTLPIVSKTSQLSSPQLRPESPFDRRQSTASVRPISRLKKQDTQSVMSPIAAIPPLGREIPSAISQPIPSSTNNLLELIARSPFKNQHILSVSQFSRQDLHHLFTVAQEMYLAVTRQGIIDILRGRLLCTMFYEPSTRTSASFDAAMQRLGGRTVAISTSHSSAQKGESLRDTVRTLACYGDAVVLRHPGPGSASIAAKYSSVPVINGGNGSIEHPTQAFLDLFTIRQELGTVNSLIITFTGDLRFGRTVHSLVKLLRHYDVHVQLISPPSLALPPDVRQQLIGAGQLILEGSELSRDVIARSDVLYCTRLQKERFDDLDEYGKLRGGLVVDSSVLKHAKQHMIVMHPLPRNEEVGEEVDFDQRAAYFRQVNLAYNILTVQMPWRRVELILSFVDAVWSLLPDGIACDGNGAMTRSRRVNVFSTMFLAWLHSEKGV